MIKLSVNQNLKTNAQMNVAEQIECLMISKNSFESMLNISFHLTSCDGWQGTATQYEEGYYIELIGTRSQCNGFIDNKGNIIRKPSKLTLIKKYNVKGEGTEIHNIY